MMKWRKLGAGLREGGRRLWRWVRRMLGREEATPGAAPPGAAYPAEPPPGTVQGTAPPAADRPRAPTVTPLRPRPSPPGPGDVAVPETITEPRPVRVPALPPGRWLGDTISVANGQIDLAPWLLPKRPYWIHEPALLAAEPCVLVVLHGCRQTADEIAEGTRLNEHADERGWLVLYPEQTPAANKHRCWNWFDPANLRGDGECALVIAMLQAVRARYSLRNAHVFLAGMSAGGALASLLALRFSHLWSGVAIHSGLPYGAAGDPWTAVRVMREGPAGLAPAQALHRAGGASPVPAMIVHGAADTVVDRRNADLLVRQFLGWNGHLPASTAWDAAPLPPPVVASLANGTGHDYVVRDYGQPHLAPVRECEVLGMGHAWSGGDSALPFHDESGPNGSALMIDFFAGIARTTPAPGSLIH